MYNGNYQSLISDDVLAKESQFSISFNCSMKLQILKNTVKTKIHAWMPMTCLIWNAIYSPLP